MRLVFLGPPGAGKGTQAARYATTAGIPHISTGDILRRAIALATPTGLAAKEYVDKGALVPFEIILRLASDRLREKDARAGWILDGFPRSLQQAEAFASLLVELGAKLDRVVYFEVSEKTLVERLSGRRVCRKCGATYHTESSPPRARGICDACGGELYQRSDDTPESIVNRLRVYTTETTPLVEFYRTRGLLLKVDAERGIEELASLLERELGKKA